MPQGFHARLEQELENSEGIVYPVVLLVALLEVVHIDEHLFAGLRAGKAKLSVGASCKGAHNDLVDGDTHGITAIIVGVVADKFDAAGGLCKHLGSASVYFQKGGSKSFFHYQKNKPIRQLV